MNEAEEILIHRASDVSKLIPNGPLFVMNATTVTYLRKPNQNSSTPPIKKISLNRKTLRASLLVAALLSSVGASAAHAQVFTAGDLLVSSSTYQDVGQAANLQVGSNLPNDSKATANGTYPNVFNNENPDASFGVTSQIDINQTRPPVRPLTSISPSPRPIWSPASLPSRSFP